MPNSIRLTDEALRQIVEISDYISQGSPQSARRWREGLRRKILSLQSAADFHAVVYTKKEAGREVRQTFYGIYRILFAIECETIVVLTIRHGARRPIGPKEVEGIE